MPPKSRAPARKTAPRKRPAAGRKPRKRVKVEVALFGCRRCGMATNNPFARIFHVCFGGGFTPAQRAAARKNLEAARKATARKPRSKGGAA